MTEVIRIGPLRLEFLQSKHDTSGGLDMFRMVVPPSGQMPVPHYHRDWDETVYGLEGTLTFTVDGEPHAIGPGDTLFIPRGRVHGFDNRGAADAICLG
ncbi:MAG TPA: cupin domain-containing protein, partial [Acetobacteraceae bacterium]|nr:cupin domain-containing protein [Acetobacteraceae bacterium]